MSAQKLTANAMDPEEQRLYRVGGIAAIVFGIAYVVIIGLYVPIGARPRGVEAWLTSLAAHTMSWWAILALSVLTDLLLVPVALALYLALKRLDRNAMLLATASVGLFVILDLALTWTNYSSLLALAGNYVTAASDAERTMIRTAAIYPSGVVDSNLLFIYNTLTLSIGILLSGLVMLKGIFHKLTAYIGLATGILGCIAVAGSFLSDAFDMTIILASLLTTVWIFLVGYRLWNLGAK